LDGISLDKKISIAIAFDTSSADGNKSYVQVISLKFFKLKDENFYECI